MGLVKYDGKRLIPAPFVNIDKRTDRTGDSTKVGTSFDITLQGKILAYKGSPDSSGVFTTGTGYPNDEDVLDTSRLASMLRKIEALRGLFGTDGHLLEIQSSDGSQPMSCNPRIVSMTFPSELWYQDADYTITLQADHVSGVANDSEETFPQYINSATESWEIQPADTIYTYSLTHSVGAVGKKFYSSSGTLDIQPWQYAQSYVIGKLGYNNEYLKTSPLFSGNQIMFSGLSPYNFKRSDTTDDLGGSYNCSESWLLASGNAVESYTMKTNHAIDDGFRTVSASIDGNIQGLYTTLEDYATGYPRALAYWNNLKGSGLLDRMHQVASGVALTTCGVNYDIQRGLISYNAEYDNRPIVNKSFDEYSIAQKYDITNYTWTYSVDGKIQGIITESEDNPTLKYNRALDQYNQLLANSGFYNRILPYTSGILNVRSTPVTNNTSFDPIGGTVQYSFEFNNRYINLSNHEYQVSSKYSRDQGFTVISINGTVQGYDLIVVSGGNIIQGSGDVLTRYNNAVNELPTALAIYNIAKNYVSGVPFPNLPVSQEYNYSPQAGTIGYAFDFSSEALPYTSGAMYESLNITDDNAVDIFAEFAIPGRIGGPYIQNMFTTSHKQRSISYECVMPIYTGNDPIVGYNSKPVVSGIIELFRPPSGYVSADQENWNFRLGRYSANKAWTYSH